MKKVIVASIITLGLVLVGSFTSISTKTTVADPSGGGATPIPTTTTTTIPLG